MKPATKGTVFRLMYIVALVAAMTTIAAGTMFCFEERFWPATLLLALGAAVTFGATEIRDAETACLIACIGEGVNEGIRQKVEEMEK